MLSQIRQPLRRRCCKGSWASDVLKFWFALDEQARFGPGLDSVVTSRYSRLSQKTAADTPADAVTSSTTALATVIVLDQFPRNLFRGNFKAFASDAAALKLPIMPLTSDWIATWSVWSACSSTCRIFIRSDSKIRRRVSIL